ncbi:MAG: SDR family oxidoreductase [Pirellulaceae bacterium]|nr:SDR family oxidoreductase [Pirellulaceae bacterium]
MPDLTNKTVLVTGASSGIGRETAIRAAENSADVILHYCTNEQGARETEQEVIERGRKCLVLQADFGLEEPKGIQTLTSFSEQAWDWKGCIDVLINNAGADVLTTNRKNWNFFEKLELLWQIDVKSCVFLSRQLGKRMFLQSQQNIDRDTGLPSIINIGWDQAQVGQGGDSGEMFAATKGAIIGFTKSLAKSYAPHVRVNCVAPGWIQTAWGESTSDYWDIRAKQESLLKRWGKPADIASAICYLASDESEFINGQVLDVNGGWGFSSA